MSHRQFIAKAIDLALQARKRGNHPFGALLVLDEKVMMVAENTVNTDHDVTGHAEVNLVSLASNQFSPDALGKMVLYASTEPCAMCAGAI
jgi:tRNA(Arg) A34 adenosine deaminase TadA